MPEVPVSGNGPPSAGNREPGMVTVIPDELKKLARLVVRGFYSRYVKSIFLANMIRIRSMLNTRFLTPVLKMI